MGAAAPPDSYSNYKVFGSLSLAVYLLYDAARRIARLSDDYFYSNFYR
jgi:hypothetical protein